MMQLAQAQQMRKDWNTQVMMGAANYMQRDSRFVAFVYNKGEDDVPLLMNLEKQYQRMASDASGRSQVFYKNRLALIGGHIDLLVRTSMTAAKAAGCFQEITIKAPAMSPNGFFQ